MGARVRRPLIHPAGDTPITPDTQALRDALERIIPDLEPEFWEEWNLRLDALIASASATDARLVCARCLYVGTGLAPEAVTVMGGYALCDDHIGHWTYLSLTQQEATR